jgi:hypothetical protein
VASSKLLNSRRALRHLDRQKVKVLTWWDSIPAADRMPFYGVPSIESALSVNSIQAVVPGLRALGWQRDQVRIAGVPTIVWIAPGAKNPKRPRGRPQTRTPTHAETETFDV